MSDKPKHPWYDEVDKEEYRAESKAAPAAAPTQGEPICTCIKEGSIKCKFPHPCRRCGNAPHKGVSCYWNNQGKTPSDKRLGGRTFQRSDATLGCAECCLGDRCDDPTHFNRDSCPYCLGSGMPSTSQTVAQEDEQLRGSSRVFLDKWPEIIKFPYDAPQLLRMLSAFAADYARQSQERIKQLERSLARVRQHRDDAINNAITNDAKHEAALAQAGAQALRDAAGHLGEGDDSEWDGETMLKAIRWLEARAQALLDSAKCSAKKISSTTKD